MKVNRPSSRGSNGAVLLGIALQCGFMAHAFEPDFKNATLQIGNVTLNPARVTSPWRQSYLVASNLIYVSKDTVQRSGSNGGPAWTTHSEDDAYLNWLTASTNVAYLLGYRLGTNGEFLGYDFPARVRCLDLQSGHWLPDLPIRDTTPAGFETTNVLAALVHDQGSFVLTGLTKKGVTNAQDQIIAAYNLCFFPSGAEKAKWTKQYPSTGERPYTGGYIWGVPPPVYAGSDIQRLSWVSARLLVCPEAMQSVYCLDPFIGTEIWRLDRVWEFQRGFIGPSVWQHYIGRFGIDETFHSEKDKVDEARSSFDRQFQCALIGGPITVPLKFSRGADTHSIFLAVAKGPARQWAVYLSDCVLYEFGDDGKPVSMGTLPQVVDGSQYCVRGSDVIWKCQNDTFVKVSPTRRTRRMSMGPGGSDCTLNLAWFRRLQYEDPKVWFIAGKGRDPVTFADNYAFCLPGGGYILHNEDSQYCFPIAAVDLSTGLDSILTVRVPFKGSLPLPESNMSTETLADGTESHHALSWHLLTITDLASRGRTLEITLADETQSAVLSFEIEGALAKPSGTAGESTTNSSETVRARAKSVPPKERNEALRSAALKGDLELVTALLAARADPKWVDQNGDNALMLAVASGRVEVIEVLLKAGSNASNRNHDGETPLICAGGVGKANIVGLLLQAGADKNAADARGITALMFAAENVDTAGAVEALLKAGADPNLKDKKGRTALQIAERSRKLNRSGAEEVINLLKPVTKL